MAFGQIAGLIATILAIVAVIYVSAKHTEADLGLAISFSISLLLFAIPYQPYNDVMLLAAALYLGERSLQPTHPLRRQNLILLALYLAACCGVIVFAVAAGVVFQTDGWIAAAPVLTIACFVRPAALLIASGSLVINQGRSRRPLALVVSELIVSEEVP